MKFFKHAIFILLLSSCSLFRSAEQNAIHKLDKYAKKEAVIYAKYPHLKVSDTIRGEAKLPNPVILHDTVILYKDSISFYEVLHQVTKYTNDTVFATEIAKLAINS